MPSLADLEIKVLGPTEVAVGDRPVQMGRRLRALLVRLALARGDVVPADRLSADLGITGESGVGALQVLVSRLRRALGESAASLRTRAPGYVLDLAADNFDVRRFESLVESSRHLRRDGRLEHAFADVTAALRLWRGPALADLAEESFTPAEAKHLDDLRLLSFEEWAEVASALGRHDETIGDLEALVAANPFRERLAASLITAQYRLGRQAQAVETFDRLRISLREIGLDPSPELVNLQRALLLQTVELRTPVRPREVSNLPLRNAGFTLRTSELAEIADVVEARHSAGRPAIIALHGMGGVGKTQLAVEFAHTRDEEYEIIWWSPAEDPITAGSSLASLARQLALPPRSDQQETNADLIKELSHRDRWLLIFDNAEAPDAIEYLLPLMGRGTVLITSRNPAWSRLAVPIRVGTWNRDDSVALLESRSQGTHTEMEALADQLGGLPLAISQATAYMETTGMSTGAYLRLLRSRRLELLDRAAPTVYGSTLASAWRLSIERANRVSPAAGQLLMVCAFLAPDGIPLDLLLTRPDLLQPELRAAVADELKLNETVGGLLMFSLLTRESDNVSIHRLLQAFVRDSIDPAQASAEANRVVLILGSAMDDTHWSRTLLAHALAAIDHTQLAGIEVGPALTLIRLTGRELRRQAAFTAAQVVIEQGLALADAARSDAQVAVPQLLTELGAVWEEMGDWVRARTVLDKAMALALGAPQTDVLGLAQVRRGLGRVLMCLRVLPQAQEMFEGALSTLVPADPHSHEVGLTYLDLGLVHWLLGDLSAAEDHLRRALRIFQQSPDTEPADIAHVLSEMAHVQQDGGHFCQARELHQQALEQFLAAFGPDHPSTAHGHDKLGYVLRLTGDLDGAEREHQRAFDVLSRVYGEGHAEVGMPLTNLGMVHLDAGRFDEALDYQRRALSVFTAAFGLDHADHPHVSLARRRIAQVHQAANDSETAARILTEVLQIARGRMEPNPSEVREILAELASVNAARDAVEIDPRAAGRKALAADDDPPGA